MGITKYKEGSVRELLVMGLPLMLSQFSLLSMIFVDRLLLAHYSTAALNAAVNSTTLGWAIVVAWFVLCAMSEVFVAQYNGAGDRDKIGEPVWQMVWIGILSILFFIPAGIYGPKLIYGLSEMYAMERDYLRWLLFFGWGFTIQAALTGFFIGQGKTALITILSVVANLVNIVLDYAFIFGVEGWIPSMGVKGAAIATSTGGMFQALVLAIVFLNRKHREQNATDRYQIQPKLMWKMLKVGFPPAVFELVEILGFAGYYWLMKLAGDDYITVAGICQSVVILFFFFTDSIYKSVMAIVGNMIGAGKQYLVSDVMRAGYRLHFCFFLLMFLSVMFFTEQIISVFLPNIDPEQFLRLHDLLTISLYSISFYMLFQGFRMMYGGALTAAGDTLFLMISGSIAIWVFLVAPIYWLVLKGNGSPILGPYICAGYGVVTYLINYARYQHGSWKTINLRA